MVSRDDAQTGGALTVKCCGTRQAHSLEYQVRFLELSYDELSSPLNHGTVSHRSKAVRARPTEAHV
jgi:hypothetical protein